MLGTSAWYAQIGEAAYPARVGRERAGDVPFAGQRPISVRVCGRDCAQNKLISQKKKKKSRDRGRVTLLVAIQVEDAVLDGGTVLRIVKVAVRDDVCEVEGRRARVTDSQPAEVRGCIDPRDVGMAGACTHVQVQKHTQTQTVPYEQYGT